MSMFDSALWVGQMAYSLSTVTDSVTNQSWASVAHVCGTGQMALPSK